jgi:dihydrofolate synthase/folylpolyglutamate synthase
MAKATTSSWVESVESLPSIPSAEAPSQAPGDLPWPPEHQALQFLNDLIRTGIKYGLENFSRLLDHLEHPEQRAHWIHVAGTNGKGSVSSMCESLLRAQGKLTTLFTSPHLVHPRERFRVDTRPVSPEALTRALAPLQRASARMEAEGHGTPTFFEACAGLTFELAGERPGSWGIAECGLGGRLDATNLLTPEVGVITSIGLDHTKTLGGSLELIAAEKAGIAKDGIPLLVSPCIPAAPLGEIQRVATEKAAEIEINSTKIVNSHLDANARVMRFGLKTPQAIYSNLTLPLLGEHQLGNAALAVRAVELALERQGETLRQEAVRQGLASVHWPGRFDVREHEGQTVVFDAVHNAQGMAAFMKIWRACFPGRSATVLFGACSDKNVESMLRPLAEFASELVFAQAHVRRAAEAGLLEARWQELGIQTVPSRVTSSVAEGWALASQGARERKEILLVCGSLYLMGNVFALEDSPPVEE